MRSKIKTLRLVRSMAYPVKPPHERRPVKSPKDFYEIVRPVLEQEVVEVVVMLPLDAQHMLIDDTIIEITRGVLNSSLLHCREVYRAAIAAGACSIVVAHNHPSGDPEPSADDKSTTDQLASAGRLLEIPFLDHLIVGAGKYVSLAEKGLIQW